jgi:hypothetical protein
MQRKGLAAAVPPEDDFFCDWRGPKDEGTPHELPPGELSRLLKPLAVRARSMRIGKDKDGKDKWDWCYTRTQIETAWRKHCSENDATVTQPSKIIALAKS